MRLLTLLSTLCYYNSMKIKKKNPVIVGPQRGWPVVIVLCAHSQIYCRNGTVMTSETSDLYCVHIHKFTVEMGQ